MQVEFALLKVRVAGIGNPVPVGEVYDVIVRINRRVGVIVLEEVKVSCSIKTTTYGRNYGAFVLEPGVLWTLIGKMGRRGRGLGRLLLISWRLVGNGTVTMIRVIVSVEVRHGAVEASGGDGACSNGGVEAQYS